MHYLDELNERQREAVTCLEGPLLVLAGAGSGKTRVLTYRLAHIVDKLRTRAVLAVTFTNKAAGEMLGRVERLLGARSEGLWVCTFHAFGNRILRREISRLRRNPSFVILDEQDRLGLIKQCLKELNLDHTTWPPKYVQWYIENAKRARLSPGEMAQRAGGMKESGAARVFGYYENRLVETGALDFNDLLILTLRLFEENPDLLDKYRQVFRFLMIDEFQDTNRMQYDLIRMLVGEEENICVVGDEDQSIYGWRGADIRNILDFSRDFPRARLIRLEQNYRSVATILEAAAHIISSNLNRIGKNLVSVRGGGDPVVHYPAMDEMDEARYVTRKVKELIKTGVLASDIAIFYRTHAQSRAVEDAFRLAGVSYIIVGGTRFYDRKEIKDVLAYLRLATNPMDDTSFLRIANVPPRKIGKATLKRLREFAASKGISMLEACRKEVSALPAAKRVSLLEFADMIDAISDEAQGRGAPAMIDACMLKTGYRSWLEEKPGIESWGRLENLDELLRAAEEYERVEAEASIEGFLDAAGLLSDIDTAPEDHGSITLMTLHTAKGLEFPVVFLIGMEDGIFPHILSREDNEAMEEERRLCYVGMTRAKDMLFMTRATTRRLRGKNQSNEPSPYLLDIPPNLLRIEGGAPWTSDSPSDTEPGADKQVWRSDSEQSDICYDETEVGLKPGRRVNHPQFGAGIVETIEGQGEKTKVKVFFHKAGHKTLMLKYAQLEPA